MTAFGANFGAIKPAIEWFIDWWRSYCEEF
jgi:hypothetical protein